LPNIALTRRRNALTLFQAYAEKAMAAGTPPEGLEQSFAAAVQISPGMWRQIKSSRPIGDKLARQLETLCSKPTEWRDQARDDASPSPAGKALQELALAAWRASNAAGRRALRQHLEGVAAAGNTGAR
jgi:hypothetical protein